MPEKYLQRKYWPTRRIHLYFTIGGDGYALCGGAMEGATYQKYKPFVWGFNSSEQHPYDDLNYCQSCRRVAEKRNGRKYIPLSKYYEKVKAKFEKING